MTETIKDPSVETSKGAGTDSVLSIEKSVPGRRALRFKKPGNENLNIPDNFLRANFPRLPELSELDAIRHFTRLSQKNFSLDTNFYPLGSCTMKYNPRINEEIAALEGFENAHPLSDDSRVQGTLKILYDFDMALREICAMDAAALAPAAGAHGEFAGIAAAKAYFKDKGENQRTKIIIPDSAHGTNPATAAMLGFETANMPSGPDGRIDIGTLKKTLSNETAVLMLTMPNTLGIFETRIEEITKAVHEAGALVYIDGANFNAMLGILKPGDFGADIMHLNMHKTFSTPHGGGGPGAGAICVKKILEDFLPPPRVLKEGDFYKLSDFPKSIGKIKSFFGNTSVLIKAYAYILSHSKTSLSGIAANAIINANYVMKKLSEFYPAYNDEYCMHECVLSCPEDLKKNGIKTLDIAKRLLDFGFHAPTIYFPLIVREAIMIEPTETESKETLDSFIEFMVKIYKEGLKNPGALKGAPFNLPSRRMDEVMAARKPNLRWAE